MRIQGIYETREVFVDGNPLSPAESHKVSNHSPDGFNWGYGGSGPSQLALAILLLVLPLRKAVRAYQEFKWNLVARLPQGDFDVQVNPLDFLQEETKKCLDIS
jgi:hypothetical protein